jgi:hypothetical protein
MTSTLLSSKTYSPVSGSLFDAFKLVLLPIDVTRAIDDMAKNFGKKLPNHVELFDSMHDVVVSKFFNALAANDMSILVFETTKISEEVNGKTKTRFMISHVPQSLGRGPKCVSLIVFLNKNGYAHYEVLMVAPYLKSSFPVIDNPDANNSIRILSIPSDYFEQLRAEKFPAVLKQTESTKLISVSQASTAYNKAASSTTSSALPPRHASIVKTSVVKNTFMCLDDDEVDIIVPATETLKVSAAPVAIETSKASAVTSSAPSTTPSTAKSVLSFAQIVSREASSSKSIQKAISANGTTSNVTTSNETISNGIRDFGPYFKESKQKKPKSKTVTANANA